MPIERCLDAFFNEEVLEKDDAWYDNYLSHLSRYLCFLQGLPAMQDQATRVQETFPCSSTARPDGSSEKI